MGQTQSDTKCLDGEQRAPKLAGLYAQHSGGAGGGTGPGHQIEYAHRQHTHTQQGSGAHVHLPVDRQHGGNHNTEGGGPATVQMADEGDHSGHDGNAYNTVAHHLHQFSNDNIKHTSICHNPKI